MWKDSFQQSYRRSMEVASVDIVREKQTGAPRGHNQQCEECLKYKKINCIHEISKYSVWTKNWPRVAQNTDGQIAFVVNNPKFSQQVKIVTCKKDSQLGWKTSSCFQQFSEVELETVQLGGVEDPEQQQKPEISGRQINSQQKAEILRKQTNTRRFRFPSGCKWKPHIPQ